MGASPRAYPPSIVPVWRNPLRGVTLGGATPTSASAVSRDDTRLWWDVTADGLRACLPAVNGLRLGAPSPGEDVRPRSSPRPLPADVPTPRHFMVTPTCLISRPPARHPSAIGIGPTTETPRLPKRWRCQASLSLSLPGYRTIEYTLRVAIGPQIYPQLTATPTFQFGRRA